MEKKVYLMARRMVDKKYTVLEMERGKVAMYLFEFLKIRTMEKNIELIMEESPETKDMPYTLVEESRFIENVFDFIKWNDEDKQAKKEALERLTKMIESRPPIREPYANLTRDEIRAERLKKYEE